MKGLRGRILLVGLLSAVLSLALSRLLVRAVAESLAVRFAGGIITAIMDRGERARCAADSSAWSFVVPGTSETFAYDPSTGDSRNPAAPPLDQDLRRRLGTDRAGVVVRLGDPIRPGVMLARAPGDGACSLVQTTWGPMTGTPRALLLYGLTAVSLGALSMAVSFVFAIRPMARRVAALRRSAAEVGTEGGYASAERGAEDDLGQLGRELDRAHARIREDHSSLERHLADVAHDLRTPIASLQLAVQHALALNRDPELEGALDRALDDTVYVGGLTENLRLASKLAGGWDPREVVSVDLRALVERVSLRMSVFATQKRIALEVALPDDLLLASCHPIAVEQAVANVIENAVSLGVPGGHVAVVLRPLPGERFTLTVVDDGPGVRVSELPRLGERTFRSDEARQRAPRGSGLGLAITAEVCARSGWELSFHQVDPQGLEVTFRGSAAPHVDEGTRRDSMVER